MSSASGPSKPTVNPYQSLSNKRGKNERVIFSSDRPFAPSFVQAHLIKSRNLDAKALYDSRVKGKQVLLENTTRERSAKRRKSKVEEKKQIAKARSKISPLKGQWSLNRQARRYDLYKPLHHLWLSYMSELLCLGPPPVTAPNDPIMPNSASMHAKLVKADYHGSILTVKQAKNPCLVGIAGIVLMDRECTFVVITDKNALKTIPKQGSIFALRIPLYDIRGLLPQAASGAAAASTATPAQPISTSYTLDTVPQMEFELYGNQFCFRSSDRASKKFKSKGTIEL